MPGPRNPRRNLAESFSEYWRPPLHSPGLTWLQRSVSALRRFFDLQAGSIWRDLSELLPEASGTLLDVGCGAQPYRGLLSADVQYIAIDTSHAGERFGYELPDTLYFSGDRWPVEDGSVDLVLCSEVLEHVLEPCLFLSEAARCLQPGGKLLLTVPFAARWHFLPHDYWRYTPSGLKHLLADANFVEVFVYARGNPLTVACYKWISIMLPLLFPQDSDWFRIWGKRLFGLLTLPLAILLAVIANLTAGTDWGNDCLGYTVSARRPPAGKE